MVMAFNGLILITLIIAYTCVGMWTHGWKRAFSFALAFYMLVAFVGWLG